MWKDGTFLWFQWKDVASEENSFGCYLLWSGRMHEVTWSWNDAGACVAADHALLPISSFTPDLLITGHSTKCLEPLNVIGMDSCSQVFSFSLLSCISSAWSRQTLTACRLIHVCSQCLKCVPAARSQPAVQFSPASRSVHNAFCTLRFIFWWPSSAKYLVCVRKRMAQVRNGWISVGGGVRGGFCLTVVFS